MSEKYAARTCANKNNSSGFIGVSFHKKNKSWTAAIRLGVRKIHIGCFASAMEAAHAYNKAAIQYRGAEALLNPVFGTFLLPEVKPWVRPYRLEVPEGLTPCIEWDGAKSTRTGYGARRYAGEMHGAHRIAFIEAHGLGIDDIRGKVVRHKCDNRICVNPDHLEIGTHADNMRDMKERGRYRTKGNKWKPV